MQAAAASDSVGEAREFEGLFREHYQLVYRTAYGVTGRAEDAEDVLQTVFLKLLRRGHSPDLYKNTKGYLYRPSPEPHKDSGPTDGNRSRGDAAVELTRSVFLFPQRAQREAFCNGCELASPGDASRIETVFEDLADRGYE